MKALSLNIAILGEVSTKKAEKAFGKAKYIVIADALRQAIKQGQVSAGEALPSARSLADQLKTNRHTVMAAYAELVAEGWVEAKQRSAYRVVASLPIQSSLPAGVVEKPQASFSWNFVRQGIAQQSLKASDYRYNFSGGQPDIRLFPFDEFRGYFSQACQRPKYDDLSYGDSQGLPELIIEISKYLRRVRSITDKHVMICNGSQEALFMVSQLLLQAGDKVAVEQLGYPPAWAAFKSSGASLVAINQDDKGIMPDHLESVLKAGQVKLIYLTPLHQYPTTVTLDVTRRMRIYQLAAHYGAAIIEDDYDHEFHYKCQPIAPMASEDPLGLVIYISTFSKLMFGGARIGYVVANNELITQLAAYKTLMNHKSNVLLQHTVSKWMQQGGFEAHLRRMTRIYQQRRDALVLLLQDYQQQGFPLSFVNPDGGMAIWVNMGKSVVGLKQKLLEQHVYLQTQPEFELDVELSHNNKSSITSPHFIRLGFAGMEPTLLEQGLAIIIEQLYADEKFKD